MLPATARISIDTPRERVFDFLSELANRPAFTDHFIREYHLERIPSSGVGAAARFRVDPPGSRMWMETVIEELTVPHRILEEGRGGRGDRIPVFTAWEMVEGPGSTTEASVTFWTEPTHPVDRIKERLGARRWHRRRWARALRRLKEVLESGRSVEPVAIAGEDRIPILPSAVRH
ncbi:MAG: SRPBCC family protein [Solirubrobacterales bacterium]